MIEPGQGSLLETHCLSRELGHFRRVVVVVFLFSVSMTSLSAMLESTFLYFPTHSEAGTNLQEWRAGGKLIGY